MTAQQLYKDDQGKDVDILWPMTLIYSACVKLGNYFLMSSFFFKAWKNKSRVLFHCVFSLSHLYNHYHFNKYIVQQLYCPKYVNRAAILPIGGPCVWHKVTMINKAGVFVDCMDLFVPFKTCSVWLFTS